MTGFTPRTRTVIRTRARDLCEKCSGWDGAEIHHRRPRAMGGSRDPITNSPANGVLLCPGCHRWIESNRAHALDNGWLVRQGHDPREVPVLYQGQRLAFLTIEGTVEYGVTLPVPGV